MAKQFTIELSEATTRYLQLLGEGVGARGSDVVEYVLSYLAQSAADGVRRPGAWQREWVLQAFGDAWADKVEQDPQNPWNVVPKKRGDRGAA